MVGGCVVVVERHAAVDTAGEAGELGAGDAEVVGDGQGLGKGGEPAGVGVGGVQADEVARGQPGLAQRVVLGLGVPDAHLGDLEAGGGRHRGHRRVRGLGGEGVGVLGDADLGLELAAVGCAGRGDRRHVDGHGPGRAGDDADVAGPEGPVGREARATGAGAGPGRPVLPPAAVGQFDLEDQVAGGQRRVDRVLDAVADVVEGADDAVVGVEVVTGLVQAVGVGVVVSPGGPVLERCGAVVEPGDVDSEGGRLRRCGQRDRDEERGEDGRDDPDGHEVGMAARAHANGHEDSRGGVTSLVSAC